MELNSQNGGDKMNKKLLVICCLILVLGAVLVIAAETKIYVNQNMMGNNITNITRLEYANNANITYNSTCSILIQGATSIICVN
jgi:hypothetical protein